MRLWISNEKICYRIPSLIYHKKNIFAFCEKRTGLSDSDVISLVMKISKDNGDSWSSEEIVYTDNKNTWGNPCPIIINDKLFLFVTWNRGDHVEDQIVAGESKRIPYYFILDCDKWKGPNELKGDFTESSWFWYATGPSKGICVNGTAIIPCNHSSIVDGKSVHKAHILYSDDEFKTTKKFVCDVDHTNESSVIEKDGSIYLFSRHFNRKDKLISATKDLKEWNEYYYALPSAICQGMIEKVGKYFIYSATLENYREKLIIYFSKDLKHWNSKILYLGPSAYSAIINIDNNSFGVLYERDNYSSLIFNKLTLDWLFTPTKPRNIFSYIKDDASIDFNTDMCIYMSQISEFWTEDLMTYIDIDNKRFLVNFYKMMLLSVDIYGLVERDINKAIRYKLIKREI